MVAVRAAHPRRPPRPRRHRARRGRGNALARNRGQYAGQVWAVAVELTPKPAARTARIMNGLLSPPRYAQVVYLTSPAARPVVLRTAAGLPASQADRVAVRDLPPAAFLAGVR
jgi:hypothetical protein